MEYLREYFFWLVGIAGILVMAWMGWRQTNIARSAKRDLARERGIRQWLLREPTLTGGQSAGFIPVDALLADLRSASVDSLRAADDFAKRARAAHAAGDYELADFFSELSEVNADAGERALDLLRYRLPDELPPASPSA